MTASSMMSIFLDIHRDLPRQGPGSIATTEQALAHCELPDNAQIADIGCGPGMQTLILAQHTDAQIIAIDFNTQYLHELRERIDQTQPDANIVPLQADMKHLPFAPNSLDMIWSEGAVYIIGVAEALKQWRPYLKSGGYLAFSEIAWIKDNPPPEITDYWTNEYPAMGTIADKLALIEASDFEVVQHFTLPDSDWWANYYTPLEAKLAADAQRYADNDMGQNIIAMTHQEIAMRRDYGDWYSYEFFVCQLPR